MTARPDMTGWTKRFHMELPVATVTQNQLLRMNRWRRARYEQELHQWVRAAVRQPPQQPVNPARIHIVRGNHGLPPDHDNLVGGAKPLLDVLCCPRARKQNGWGFIIDDAPQFVSVTYESAPAKAGQGFTIIEIWGRADQAARAAA